MIRHKVPKYCLNNCIINIFQIGENQNLPSRASISRAFAHWNNWRLRTEDHGGELK